MTAEPPFGAPKLLPCSRNIRRLEVEFTFRNMDLPADSGSRLPRETQDFVLGSVRRVPSTNIEVAYQFAQRGAYALGRMNRCIIEAWADVHSGLEMTDRAFTRLRWQERHNAAMVMVDMSGSTNGWINDAEREALTLLSEALEALGDRYAIYGFSGSTRKRCELFRVKSFTDAYDSEVRARLSGIKPQDCTRMGAAIRHPSHLLQDTDARTKALITLSGGKPEDYDSYCLGEYGVEDTRQAVFEARRAAIHPFCVTIEEQARYYLPHMYGAANFVVLQDVQALPFKISDIYRKLTT